MSAAPDTTISALFDLLEPQQRSSRSRQEQIDLLLGHHDVVARQHAEATFMRLSGQPDLIDGSASDDELDARLRAAFDALLSAATEVRERHGANDEVTRLLAEARLIRGFYFRFNKIASVLQRGFA